MTEAKATPEDMTSVIPPVWAAESDTKPAADTASTQGADPLKVAERVAVATALTATLAAGPVAPEQIQLSEPVPIVQVIDFAADQPSADLPADDQATDRHAALRKVLKAIALVLAALLTVAGLVFGAIKGCAGQLTGPDVDQEQQQEQVAEGDSPAE